MTGLRERVPSAIAYGALLLGPLVAGPRWFALVVGALGALAYLELVRLFHGHRGGPAYAGLVLVAVFTYPRLLVGRDPLLDIVVLGLGITSAVAGLALASVPPLRRLAFTVAGSVYLGWVFGYLSDLARAGSFHTVHGPPEAFPTWLLLALLPTWAGDIAAYAVGSAVGRRRLAPRLSPGKTWEGTVAGFAAAALVAFAVAAFAGVPRLSTAVIVLAIGPAALAGDLFESFLKRRAGAKDSGTLFPGHGGVFDRVDSLIAVAPVVTVALFLAGTLG